MQEIISERDLDQKVWHYDCIIREKSAMFEVEQF